MDSSGVSDTVSEAKIAFALLLYCFSPHFSLSRHKLPEGGAHQEFTFRGFSLSHRLLLLSFCVPCGLEVTSGMCPQLFCISLCKAPSLSALLRLPLPWPAGPRALVSRSSLSQDFNGNRAGREGESPRLQRNRTFGDLPSLHVSPV